MKKVLVANEFHGTTATMTVNNQGGVSSEEYDRTARHLCGMSDCACGGLHANMDGTVCDADGRRYVIED